MAAAQGPHSTAAVVHVGKGHLKHQTAAPESSGKYPAVSCVTFLKAAEDVTLKELFDDHEPGIVTGIAVFSSGIAQPDDEAVLFH